MIKIKRLPKKKFSTILADPPWQFQNSTGKIAPEHKRLNRYPTLDLEKIKALPVDEISKDRCHLYLWVPNALVSEGLEVMKSWGFQYKSNIIWQKIRKDGEPDGRGVWRRGSQQRQDLGHFELGRGSGFGQQRRKRLTFARTLGLPRGPHTPLANLSEE